MQLSSGADVHGHLMEHRLRFAAWDPEVEGTNIFIVDADGKNIRHLTREEPRDLRFDPKVPLAYRPAWSPDGHCLDLYLGISACP